MGDEVQAGFGRTGDQLWGYERHMLAPDIVTLGKPMGNGHPIAGLVMKPEIVEGFGRNSRYFNTFGGNPVSCAAGMAVLDVLEKQHLQESAHAVGLYIRERLRALAASYPIIADVRGAGLFIGVEIVSVDSTCSAEELTVQTPMAETG